MTEKEVVCIVCPSSCRLTVREENGTITVEGNGCKRGIEHGISEFTNPMRMLTSTVVVNGGSLPRLPVISTGEVPKAKLGECLKLLYGVTVSAPIHCGDVIVKDICGTGVDVVASRSMNSKEA